MISDSFLSLWMQLYITSFSQPSSIWITKGQRFGITVRCLIIIDSKGTEPCFLHYRGVSLLWTPKRQSQVSTLKNDAWGRGYSLEFLVGVCRLVLQILTLFQTKKINVISHTCFLTRPLKSIPVFRRGF